MGSGTYSHADRMTRLIDSGFHTKTREEIFTASGMNESMDPKHIKMREARDSEEHPNSFAIIIGLDVTGSMGSVPHYLVKDGLPEIVQKIMDNGIADPQILFVGIGDHKCDQAPLQVGQFESSDELMDKWLTDLWLEGNGGGNGGESYFLAWLFAAQRTSVDCFEKRNKKGVLITIGDEPIHRAIHNADVGKIMGQGEYNDYETSVMLDMARTSYDVYHINVMGETSQGDTRQTIGCWQELLGDNAIMAQKKESVVEHIAGAVIKSYNGKMVASPVTEESEPKTEGQKEDIIL